jgi:hypothetical protein
MLRPAGRTALRFAVSAATQRRILEVDAHLRRAA